MFLLAKWSPFTKGFSVWFQALRLPELFKNCKSKALDPRFVALSMFTCNLIGILCARSLHYQFYSWYYHSIPLILLYVRGVPLIVK